MRPPNQIVLLMLSPWIFPTLLHGQDQSSADSIAAVLKDDLRNLVVAEEAYFADHSTYAPAVGESEAAGVASWQPSPGGTLVLSNVTARGLTAVLSNSSLTSGPIHCGVYLGPATNAPNVSVIQEGMPGCWGSGLPPAGSQLSAEILGTMRSDLRNLVTVQEAYFADENTYAPAIGSRWGKGVVGFAPSGQNGIVLSNVTAQGWTAVITNPALTGGINTCGVFIGPASNAPNTVVKDEGRPACWSR